MAIQILGEVLDHARDFEYRLERWYADLRDSTPDNGVRLLTYYLARHRRHQDEAFGDTDPECLARLRAIELRHAADFDPETRYRLLGADPAHVTGISLLQAAIGYDEALVQVYRFVREQPMIDEARDLVDALIRIEERDIVMLKKMAAMHYF